VACCGASTGGGGGACFDPASVTLGLPETTVLGHRQGVFRRWQAFQVPLVRALVCHIAGLWGDNVGRLLGLGPPVLFLCLLERVLLLILAKVGRHSSGRAWHSASKTPMQFDVRGEREFCLTPSPPAPWPRENSLRVAFDPRLGACLNAVEIGAWAGACWCALLISEQTTQIPNCVSFGLAINRAELGL
jgi:hypothetical protein